jgi:hypothetical protein
MNAPYDIIRRTNQLLVAGADLLKSPLLLALRLYFFLAAISHWPAQAF